ncbi:hypothetical protein, partial [Desulfobacter curvatus]
GMASAHALCHAGAALSFSTQAKSKKNCLSLAMVKKLVQVVLSINSFTWKGAINMIKYHLKRNDIAYESHRKRTMALAKELGVQVSL